MSIYYFHFHRNVEIIQPMVWNKISKFEQYTPVCASLVFQLVSFTIISSIIRIWIVTTSSSGHSTIISTNWPRGPKSPFSINYASSSSAVLVFPEVSLAIITSIIRKRIVTTPTSWHRTITSINWPRVPNKDFHQLHIFLQCKSGLPYGFLHNHIPHFQN